MPTLRFAMVTAAAGICLWWLFSLLDSLGTPDLQRTPSAATIKGCELLDNEETRAVCPQLFCQKAVIDTKRVSYKSRFAVTVDKEDGTVRLIGGDVSNKAPTDPTSSFACLVRGTRIVAVRVTDRAGLREIASRQGGWRL